MKILFLLLLIPSIVLADGGSVLMQKKLDTLTVTVFASPVPLRAGPADISLLLQENDSTQAVLDASVEIAWKAPVEASSDSQWLPACCSMNGLQGWQQATRTHSKNKLLYAVFIPIKNSGPSQLAFRITRKGNVQEFTVDLNAAPAPTPLSAYWPFLALPPVAVGLFAVNRRLRGRRIV